jgi:hypothetical protein
MRGMVPRRPVGTLVRHASSFTAERPPSPPSATAAPPSTIPNRRAAVAAILDDVRRRGDAALIELGERLDGVRLERFEVAPTTAAPPPPGSTPGLAAAIDASIERVRAFHRRQPAEGFVMAGADGVLGQLIRPLERVGCYVPSGAATLVSSLIMTAVPAQVAGVDEIVVATPPRRDGGVDPALLYAAEALGLGPVYRLGVPRPSRPWPTAPRASRASTRSSGPAPPGWSSRCRCCSARWGSRRCRAPPRRSSWPTTGPTRSTWPPTSWPRPSTTGPNRSS